MFRRKLKASRCFLCITVTNSRLPRVILVAFSLPILSKVMKPVYRPTYRIVWEYPYAFLWLPCSVPTFIYRNGATAHAQYSYPVLSWFIWCSISYDLCNTLGCCRIHHDLIGGFSYCALIICCAAYCLFQVLIRTLGMFPIVLHLCQILPMLGA